MVRKQRPSHDPSRFMQVCEKGVCSSSLSTEEPKALAYQAGEAKTVSFGANIVTDFARREDTVGIYSLIEFTLAPPSVLGPPLHLHKDAHEATSILEGELDVTIGVQTMRMPTGSFISVPRGTWHTLANPGPGPTKLLILLTPPGYEGFWEMAKHLAKGAPPSPEVVASLQQKSHLETGG
jgi:quercetin dioxygenase-like cupin family protein